MKFNMKIEDNNERYKENCKVDGYPNLEPSTIVLIKSAISNGIKYEIIDENKSFIKLYDNMHTEYVVQATKTSKDKDTFPFISDNKALVKKILREHNISVPDGVVINSYMKKYDQNRLIKPFEGNRIVVKPNTTNCGIGITVFNKIPTKKETDHAIRKAFKYDSNVILEDFKEGKEYRFLVIGNKCICVVHRRNASVVGNGKNTIRELINIKNEEPWHYVQKTLIVIDKSMERLLKKQNLTLESIPQKDERIFVRHNSNISTGGESIDVTDKMPEDFKKIAEKATKLFDAKICGVDMIINDTKKSDYSIVELNDNPGIDICEWPYEGEGQHVGDEILKLLKFI